MDNKTLFVGNINFEATKEDLIALFSPYGSVEAVSLRPNKGFGSVTMSKREEALAVIEALNETEFKNRQLRISFKMAKKKAKIVTRARRQMKAKSSPPPDSVT